MEIVWWVFEKLKIEFPYDQHSNPKELNTRTQTDTCVFMFVTALFIIVKR
jgi:hypothetical protein